MFGRGARTAERVREHERAQAGAEADRLAREADQLDMLDMQAGRTPGYQHEITAERAARIRDYIAPDLVRDARAHATAQAPEAPVLQGAELGRLAEQYPEPGGPGRDQELADPYLPGHYAEAEEEARQFAEEQERRYQAWKDADDAARERRRADPAWKDAAAHEAGAPDHLYGAPECAEADPETAHFGDTSPEAEDRGHWALPRVLEPDEVSPVRVTPAAQLPDGTPNADPFLADRGWQARDGVYVRAPQAQAEASRTPVVPREASPGRPSRGSTGAQDAARQRRREAAND